MQGRPGHHLAGLEKRERRLVIDGVGMHAADDGDIVHHARRVGQQLGNPRAGFAVLRELENRRRDGKARLAAGHGGEALAVADGFGQVLIEHAPASSVCSRKSPSAAARPPGESRGSAWPWARNSADRADRRWRRRYCAREFSAASEASASAPMPLRGAGEEAAARFLHGHFAGESSMGWRGACGEGASGEGFGRVAVSSGVGDWRSSLHCAQALPANGPDSGRCIMPASEPGLAAPREFVIGSAPRPD